MSTGCAEEFSYLSFFCFPSVLCCLAVSWFWFWGHLAKAVNRFSRRSLELFTFEARKLARFGIDTRCPFSTSLIGGCPNLIPLPSSYLNSWLIPRITSTRTAFCNNYLLASTFKCTFQKLTARPSAKSGKPVTASQLAKNQTRTMAKLHRKDKKYMHRYIFCFFFRVIVCTKSTKSGRQS